jgi:hypothetical protein
MAPGARSNPGHDSVSIAVPRGGLMLALVEAMFVS